MPLPSAGAHFHVLQSHGNRYSQLILTIGQCQTVPLSVLLLYLNRPVRELEWKPPSGGLPLQFPDESNRQALRLQRCIESSFCCILLLILTKYLGFDIFG